jgi:hypothetical protein
VGAPGRSGPARRRLPRRVQGFTPVTSRSRCLVLLLLLWALPGLAPAGEGRSSRPRVSANGRYSVRLVQLAPGDCRLEVTSESGLRWALEQCVGSVDDLYFPSEDGERVWVLVPLPPKGSAPAQGAEGRRGTRRSTPGWAQAPVAALWGREGRLQERRLHELVDAQDLSEVRHLARHLQWLEGTMGIPGIGPRLTEAGRVEFETVGRKTRSLRFE